MEIERFYDEYVEHQVKIGVNLRHLRILGHLRRFGLRRSDRVLEIGCGIGSVTGLIADFVNKGAVVGVDISPNSIETARRLLARRKNIEFVVSDMLAFGADEPFDFVVMPDVLEHIPQSNHDVIIQNVCRVLRPSGTLLIHIPNPRFLEWMASNEPDQLQVVDLPVHTHDLAARLYRAGLHIVHLETYSIFNEAHDYRLIVVRHREPFKGKSLRNKYRLALETMLLRILRRI